MKYIDVTTWKRAIHCEVWRTYREICRKATVLFRQL